MVYFDIKDFAAVIWNNWYNPLSSEHSRTKPKEFILNHSYINFLFTSNKPLTLSKVLHHSLPPPTLF